MTNLNMNQPVVGWDDYIDEYLTCSSSRTRMRKVVFRGQAKKRSNRYGTCTNACDWQDNGRLYAHYLGTIRPDLFDVVVSNAGDFDGVPQGNANEVWLNMSTQLCDYAAILNLGNSADWAVRLRTHFYGNAVVMTPENQPHEFYTAFMKPYLTYWPVAA